MSGKLEQKVALITGGNSGIGLATAEQFVAEGAYVFITGRRQSQLDAAARKIGHNVTAVQGDVARIADLDRLFATVSAEKGRIDILFANASTAEFADLGEITPEHFDRIFGTNVGGLLFTVQKALPLMAAGSSVILNASISESKGQPRFSVYCAAKAALRSFARTWTSDLRGRGIRVNAVSPGYIHTLGLDGLLASSGISDQDESLGLDDIPLGRFGTHEEIAKAVVFLASDDSSYMTGAEMFVDGGYAQV
jgi:NAD(P)-dependent dehydrogenase (short-subunit alcohol dehydrogenase family)